MRRASSIRTRLTWAFLLVAVAAMALVMLGFNLAFWSTVQQRVEMGRGLGMSGMGRQGGLGGQGSQGGMGQGGMSGQGTMWETLYEGRQLAFIVSILAGVLGLIFAAVVSYVVAERFTRPLRGLATAASSERPAADAFAVHENDPQEMRELAGALGRMTERLQQEDEARRNLFADIAHELRHPIALLRGRLEMMQDGIAPVTPESLSGLQDEVIRLGRLVGDLRELSLAEVGNLSLNLQPIDLTQQIATLQENFEPITADKEIELRVETGALPTLTADPDRIRQILANLLSNAIRHTPVGGRITLRAAHQGDQVIIEVADTGSGIAPEDLDHVFDRFYRADRSRARSTGGTGLGLTISRSLARLHGGDLTAANGPDGGALFVLSLPAPLQSGLSS